MNTKFITLILLLAGGLYFISKSDNNNEIKPIVAAPYHLIIGIDPSGTTKGNGWPMPDKDFFQEQINFLEQNGGGTLEVFNLCNSIPSPVKLRMESLKAVPDVYSGEQEVKKVEQLNQTIKNRNDNSLKSFWEQIDKKIINYQPIKGNDYTYAVLHCNTIYRSLNLPQYSYFNQYVLMYSDMLDDTPQFSEKNVPKELLIQISSISNLSICNHNTKANYDDINATILPHFKDFNDLIHSTTKK